MSSVKRLCLSIALFIPAIAAASGGPTGASIEVQVIRSEPVYDQVMVNRPIEECRWEQVPQRGRHRPSETVNLIGAIAGGALGRHMGHGGQEEWLGTIVGGIFGHTLSKEIQQHRRTHVRPLTTRIQVCHETDRWEPQYHLTGYQVTYEFAGNEFTSFSKVDPGSRMRIELVPAE